MWIKTPVIRNILLLCTATCCLYIQWVYLNTYSMLIVIRVGAIELLHIGTLLRQHIYSSLETAYIVQIARAHVTA